MSSTDFKWTARVTAHVNRQMQHLPDLIIRAPVKFTPVAVNGG